MLQMLSKNATTLKANRNHKLAAKSGIPFCFVKPSQQNFRELLACRNKTELI